MLSRPLLGLLVLKRLSKRKEWVTDSKVFQVGNGGEMFSSGGEDWRSLGERGKSRDQGLRSDQTQPMGHSRAEHRF